MAVTAPVSDGIAAIRLQKKRQGSPFFTNNYIYYSPWFS